MFSDTLSPYGGEILKRILTYLYWTKYNETNPFHWGVQKHVSYTGSRKIFLIHYGPCFEKPGSVFLLVFHSIYHFSTKLKKGLSVRPSVHDLTLLNILQMSWNLCMLFTSDIEWSILKILCTGLKVCQQRHTKVFRYIMTYWGNF